MYREDQELIGLYEQTSWNGFGTSAYNYRKQNYNLGSSKIQSNTKVTENPGHNTTSLLKASGRTKVDSLNGYKTLPFTMIPTVKDLSNYLQAFFQRGTEDVAPPYRKYWQPLATPPDFKNGDGTVFTIAIKSGSPSISDGELLGNAILQDLSLSIKPLEAGFNKFLTMKGTWLGTHIQNNINYTGSWIDVTTPHVYYNDADLFELESADLIVNSVNLGGCFSLFEMNMKNTILPTNCLTSSGEPNQILLGKQTITYVIELPYNSANYTIVNSFRQGHVVKIDGFSNGIPDTTEGGITFRAPYCLMTSEPKIIKDEYKAIRLEFELLDDLSNPVPILMSDNIDRGL